VERLAASGVSVGVYANPVMPLLTDREESLEALAAAAKQAGATHFGAGILFLMPSAQKAFFPFLEEKFPLLVRRYRERFENNPYLRGAYQEMVRDRVRKVRRRHGLSASPIEYQPQIPAPWDAQLPLFGEPRRGS
jgi:DNA repair photolyase